MGGGSLFLSSCTSTKARQIELEHKEEAGGLNAAEQKELAKLRKENGGTDWVVSASSALAAIAGAFFGIRRTIRNVEETDTDNRAFTRGLVDNHAARMEARLKALESKNPGAT